MKWYLDVLKQYAVFDGRARRKEYWMFLLVHVVVVFVLVWIERLLGMGRGEWGILSALYSLAVLLPAIGVSIRPLHDTGRSGWWLLLSLVPCLGTLVLIFFFAQDGTPGANEYGANPKGA